MAEVRFELDKAAVRSDILQSQWMLDAITKIGNEQGADEVRPFIGYDRAKVFTYTARRKQND